MVQYVHLPSREEEKRSRKITTKEKAVHRYQINAIYISFTYYLEFILLIYSKRKD